MYAAAYLLENLGYALEAEQQELEDFAVDVAESRLESEEVAAWFEQHSRRS